MLSSCLSLEKVSFCTIVCLHERTKHCNQQLNNTLKQFKKKNNCLFEGGGEGVVSLFAETLRNYINFCVMSAFVLLEQQNFTFAVFVQKHTIANPATLAGTECMQCTSEQVS